MGLSQKYFNTKDSKDYTKDHKGIKFDSQYLNALLCCTSRSFVVHFSSFEDSPFQTIYQ